MDSSREIKLGAVLSYGMIVFNIICGLLYTPWMIRQIGNTNYGLYILITTFLSYFVVDYGLWQAITKLLSKKRADGDEEGVKDVIGISTKVYMILDVLVVAILIIVYFNIELFFSNLPLEQLEIFKNAFIIAAFFGAISFPFGFVKGIFTSYEFYVEAKIFDFLVKFLIIVFTVVSLIFGGGLYSLVLCYGLVPFIISLSRVFFLYYRGVRLNIKAYSSRILKEIFTVSGWLFVIVLAELFINNISPTIIAARSKVEEVAVFGIGLTIYNYVYSFAMSINGLFLPRVTELFVNKKIEEIHHLTSRLGRLQALFIGFICFCFFAVGGDFIQIWVGKDFDNSYYVAILLLLPQLLMSMVHIENVHLFVANKVKFQTIFMVLTAISSVVISFILTPYIGAIGAAVAIATANMCFMVIGMITIYKCHLRFQLSVFVVQVTPILSVLLISFISITLVDYFVKIDNLFIHFLLKTFLFGAIYIVLVKRILNQYERDLINKLLCKIGCKL